MKLNHYYLNNMWLPLKHKWIRIQHKFLAWVPCVKHTRNPYKLFICPNPYVHNSYPYGTLVLYYLRDGDTSVWILTPLTCIFKFLYYGIWNLAWNFQYLLYGASTTLILDIGEYGLINPEFNRCLNECF